MSTIMADNKDTEKKDIQASITIQDVAQWLRDHPDALAKHPELLDLMTPPQENKGKGVVDFQNFMVRRLKADREEVIQATREIVETSRANMSNQARIHRAVLMMLSAGSFEDFVRTVTMDLAPVLSVDIVSMLIEADGDVVPHIDIPGVKVVPENSITGVMGEKSIMLQDNIQGTHDLYGGGAMLVKSQALLRLSISPSTPDILIAFGCRDPQAYVEGQGTELAIFMGAVMERCFRSWLDLPRG